MKHSPAMILVLALLMPVVLVQADLAEQLPESTLASLQWHGRSLVFDGSLAGQMLLDPASGNLVGFFRQAVKRAIRREGAEAQEFFDAAWSLAGLAWQHPIAVALLDADSGQLARQNPEEAFAAAVVIDLGKDKPAFEEQLNKLLPEGQSLTPLQVDGMVWQAMKERDKVVLAWGFRGSVFYLAVGPSATEKLKPVWEGKTLARNARYDKAMRPVTGDHMQISLYMDYAALRQRGIEVEQAMAGPGDPAATQPTRSMVRTMTDALGVGQIQTIVGSVRIVDKGMLTTMHIATPGPHTGLLLPLAGTPLGKGDLARFPADADVAVAWNLSPAAVLDAIRASAGKIDPSALAMINGGLQALSKQLDTDVEADLIGAMGDTWTLSSAISQGGWLTGTVMTVEIEDEEAFSTALNQLLQKFTGKGPSPVSTLKSDGIDIHYLRLPGRAYRDMPLLPAWCIHKKTLYVALWPQVIAATLQNPTDPLEQTPGWAELARRMQGKPSGLIFINSPAIYQKVYNLHLIFGTLVTGQLSHELDMPADQMPLWPVSIQKMLQFMKPELTAVSHDDAGITIQGYGAGPTTPMVLPAATVGLLPALFRARSQAQVAVSGANLRSISTACMMYRVDHDGKMPPDFNALKEYLGLGQTLVAPHSGHAPPTWDDSAKAWKGKIDYVLVDYGDQDMNRLKMPATMVVAYKRPDLAVRNRIHVAFADGHIELLTLPEFNRRLAATKDALQAEAEQSDF